MRLELGRRERHDTALAELRNELTAAQASVCDLWFGWVFHGINLNTDECDGLDDL